MSSTNYLYVDTCEHLEAFSKMCWEHIDLNKDGAQATNQEKVEIYCRTCGTKMWLFYKNVEGYQPPEPQKREVTVDWTAANDGVITHGNYTYVKPRS